MPTGRPLVPLELSADEASQLQSLAGSRTLPYSVVRRAQIVVGCAAGETNTAVAKRFGIRGSTVGKWRQRYLDLGIEGLHDELRPGRPRTHLITQLAPRRADMARLVRMHQAGHVAQCHPFPERSLPA
jgi:hypothetical protein